MYLTFMLFLVQANQDQSLPVRKNLGTDFKTKASPSNNSVMIVSYRKTCTLFLLSFKIQSNPKTPPSTSSDIVPISSLVSFGRNKAKKPSGDTRRRRRENTAEAPAKKSKNSNDSTQAKNIFISSDRTQMWNIMSLSSDPSTCSEECKQRNGN